MKKLNKNADLIMREAVGIGLSVDIVSREKELLEISDGSVTIRIMETFHLAENPKSESVKLSKSKELTHLLWERDHIPFPHGRYFRNTNAFKTDKRTDFHFPVVVKESGGSKSRNIHTNIRSLEELRAVSERFHGGFIVQEMAFGREYRLLVLGDHIIGALEMIPPKILGNGVDTVLALVEARNADFGNTIIINEKVLETIEKRGFSPTSVPQDGEQVLLQENSCLAEGGSSRDCTDAVHEGIVALAAQAARAVNLRLGGIDLICEDISKSPDSQKILFLEINSRPSLSIHYEPGAGDARRVIRDILYDIFKK
ncbi:MAG: hypothetical protein HGB34_00280 [Candidatus Moranbacteria bacterium]|nr:hypothetical protein [Candidatus Moranbacteria bacterium]